MWFPPHPSHPHRLQTVARACSQLSHLWWTGPWHWVLSIIENINTIEGLLHIVVSHNLQLTSDNTPKGIETWGVLCGKLMRNAFTITYVLPCRQNSGPDYCHTARKRNFPLAGWPWTPHSWLNPCPPNPMAFSSSVPTYCSYQMMLP